MSKFDSAPLDAEKVRIIASEKTWLEGNAVRQLEQTATLAGIVKAVGMPDLHVGKGCPIGAAFLSKNWIYPFLIGNDIGCGMGIWKTGLKTSKIRIQKWVDKLHLDGPWQGDTATWMATHDLPADLFANAMGTIGGGNHFAELQMVQQLEDPETCKALGFDKNHLYLLVHSGSRGLGHHILTQHIENFGSQGLLENTPQADAYLQAHDQANAWAIANRALIAERFVSSLRSEQEKLLDLSHNTVTAKTVNGEKLWLHRKGTSPADGGPLVIPGSRGSFSYLVMPTGDQMGNAFSLAHGAGRKWNRSEARDRLSSAFRQEDFYKTSLGGWVICEDKSLIYEEAPQAYKNIDQVIADMVQAGLIRILAILKPLLTYKTRRQS